MRRKEREIKDKKDIERILKDSRVLRLAMVDKDKPYLVPMNFGYRDGALYLHSALEGRKIDLLKKIPLYVLKWTRSSISGKQNQPATGAWNTKA